MTKQFCSACKRETTPCQTNSSVGRHCGWCSTPYVAAVFDATQSLKEFVESAAVSHNAKETNPKDAVGVRKAPFSTVPANVTAQLGLAMLEGARKYGRHNYRVVGVRASVYYDALLRHMTAWWEGQDDDPDSGLPHVVKALACLAVLIDAKDNDKLTDDRPPSLSDDWQKPLNERAAEIVDRYPNAKEPYTRES